MEAMRAILRNKIRGTDYSLFHREVAQACRAFADAECGGGGMDCSGPDSKFADIEHAACRASLRKECGL